MQVVLLHRQVRDEHQANTGLSKGEPCQINTVHDGTSDKYYHTQQHYHKVSYDESIINVSKSDANIVTLAAVHILRPQHAKHSHMQCMSG